MDSEEGSIASKVLARSGSRDIEEGSKVAEEYLTAERRNAQQPSKLDHWRSNPIVTVEGSKAISDRPIGPLS